MNFLLKILLILITSSFVLSNCVTFSLDLTDFEDVPDGDWVVNANGSWNSWGWGINLTDTNNDNIKNTI